MGKQDRKATEILKALQLETDGQGKLRVYFGFAAGVGKTYAMLNEAHKLLEMGKDVLVGYVEPHNRPETNALLEGLPLVPPKAVVYQGITLYEPNIDELLALSPEVVLIDELAHTNPPSCRNKKRYQDVAELLNAGIDVMTTINVQHLESLNDLVEEITGVQVQETVPDTFFKHAFLKVIDVEYNELIERLMQGKIYADMAAKQALQNFFTPEKLEHLRGLAIKQASDHINKISKKTMGIQTKFLTVINDESPKMGEKCIRWTSRFAQALDAEWIVVQIKSIGEQTDNITLAEKLGAETLTIEEDGAFETIVEYAKIAGITDIVMGKNLDLKWYQKFFLEELEDRMIQRLKETEIHLIPYQGHTYRTQWKKKFELALTGGWKDFTIAIGAVMIATLITEVMRSLHFGQQNLILIYIFFVLLVARVTRGYIWSGLSAILGVLSFNWFFVEPLYSLTVYKQGYPITLIIMFIVAVMISNLMVRLKNKANTAMEKEHQMEILYELNKEYILTSKDKKIHTVTTQYLSRLMEKEIVLYNVQGELKSVATVEGQPSVLNNREEAAVAFWAGRNKKEAGYGTDTLGGSKGLYLPVLLEGNCIAVIGIEGSTSNPIRNSQFNYLKLVAAQLAVVMEQASLKRERQQMQVENEREKVRSNLLRAVSHDLCTPLTGIAGVVDTLIDEESDPTITKQTKLHLLHDIKAESQWLIRMVENLLSMTRIDMNTMQANKTQESVEEILESVLKRIKKAYPDRKVVTHLPGEFILLEVDPILIEQALFNLIENAIRHGNKNASVDLTVRHQKENVEFLIHNKGKIPHEQFKKIQRNLTGKHEVPVDSKSGLGIGLSIVKTIINAHNSSLIMEDREGETYFPLC